MAEKKNEKKDDAQKADEGEAKKSGGKKLLIIGLAAGLLVGGGAAASYFLFLAPASEPAPVAEAASAEPAAEPESTIFIKVDRVSAPLVHDDQVLGYVLLDLSLEVKNHENELLVAQKIPALKAAFLREVTREPIGKEGEPLIIDYDKLTKRLLAAANQELGKSAILRILVTQSTRV